MKHDNFFPNFLIFISSVFLFLILILGSFSLIFNYKSVYYSEYEKNNVYEDISERNSITLEESQSYVKNITENIFDFFKGKEDLKYFSDEEKSHMNDVKFIVSAMNFVYYSSSIFFILLFVILYLMYKKDKLLFIEQLSKILFYASLSALIFLIIIFLWSVFSFDSLFYLMHSVFFPQGNWMFATDSLLITLFPESFFFDMSLRIFVYAIFQSGVFFLIGYWLRKQVNLSKKFRK